VKIKILPVGGGRALERVSGRRGWLVESLQPYRPAAHRPAQKEREGRFAVTWVRGVEGGEWCMQCCVITSAAIFFRRRGTLSFLPSLSLLSSSLSRLEIELSVYCQLQLHTPHTSTHTSTTPPPPPNPPQCLAPRP
jgi:hypothetical protein